MLYAILEKETGNIEVKKRRKNVKQKLFQGLLTALQKPVSGLMGENQMMDGGFVSKRETVSLIIALLLIIFIKTATLLYLIWTADKQIEWTNLELGK